MHGYTSKNGMGSYLLTESRFLTFSAEVETEIAKKISVRSFHLSREKDVCLEGRHRENVTPDSPYVNFFLIGCSDPVGRSSQAVLSL